MESKSNPKKFWSYANSKLKLSESIGDIIIKMPDGWEKLLTEEYEKVEAFGEYFSTVFNKGETEMCETLPFNDVHDHKSITFSTDDIRKG